MQDLALFIDSSCLYAFLIDTDSGDGLPVYDINDRTSKKYTYSLFLHEKMAALSKYGSDLAYGAGNNIRSFGTSNDGDGMYYYCDNFLKDYSNSNNFTDEKISAKTALALLLNKVFFDANYVSGFDGFNEIYFILMTADTQDETGNCFVNAASVIDYNLHPHVIHLTDLVSYNGYQTNRDELFTNSNIMLMLSGQTIFFEQKDGKTGIVGKNCYGANQLLSSFGDFLINRIKQPGINDSDLNLMHLRNLFTELLGKLDTLPEIPVIWLFSELNKRSVKIKLTRVECVDFLRSQLDKTILFVTEDEQRSTVNDFVVFSEFSYSITISRLLEEIVKKNKLSLGDMKHLSPDSIRHLFYKNICNYKLFQGTDKRKVISDQAHGVNADYFITTYNPKSDAVSNLNLFQCRASAPAYFSAIVRGRFRNQDRIYFDIIKRNPGGAVSVFSRLAILCENDIDFGEVITVNLRFTYTKEDTIKIDATENFTGKRLEINHLSEVRGDDYESIRQKNIFKSMKIFNNYMDKKKEQSLGIF